MTMYIRKFSITIIVKVENDDGIMATIAHTYHSSL